LERMAKAQQSDNGAWPLNTPAVIPGGKVGAQGSLGAVALVAVGLVTIGSMFLPIVKGYGTILFQIVTLYGWHSAQALTSPGFVRNHREFGWSFAVFASTPTFFMADMSQSVAKRWTLGNIHLVRILYRLSVFPVSGHGWTVTEMSRR
jgi:hypothetical protein